MATQPVASPCNLVCTIDAATGWCLGCGRDLREIADWMVTSDAEKQAILAHLPDRLAILGGE